jgi:hypothetical protein
MAKVAVAAASMVASATALAQGPDREYLEHRIAAGESPYTLARDYLSSPGDYRAILTANAIRDPRLIPVGTVIRLPRHLLAWRTADLRVDAFSGEVTINGQPAARGMAAPEGARIATGRNGFVSLRGTTGAVVTMPTNTRAQVIRARIYRLDNLQDIELRVLGGRGEAQVPTLRPQERYRIGTPTTVSAVRGTVFRVGYDDSAGRSVVEVAEGAVATAAGGAEAITGAGFGIAATSAGLLAQEALQPPPAITAPGAVQSGAEVAFVIPQPERAAAIRTQIARDAGFTDIIGETITSGGADAAFGGLADGRYFVRARAISASGIEGNSEVYSFRRKRLGATAAAQPSPLEDGFRFAWRPEGAGETTYAFQLWNAASPGVMIVDETAMQAEGIVIAGLARGIYEWRVAAIQIDEEGLLQVWGPTQRLTVSE